VNQSTDHDNAYSGLVEADEDARWAFGTGFEDPLAGVDASVPPGVDGPVLAAYCLMLGDDALVMAQRLVQWCTRAPELEEEVALSNIALDLLGQTRLLYARAAAADPASVPALPEGSPVPAEDRLAFFRGAEEFRCVRLVELPDTDFATAMVRLAVFASWRLALLEALECSVDPVLAAVAAKAVKEVHYHRDHAARWVVTLADGTEESRGRTLSAVAATWPYVDELGRPDDVSTALLPAGAAADPVEVWRDTVSVLQQLLDAADVDAPSPAEPDDSPEPGGRAGRHTEWLAPLLDEMQGLARQHPAGRW
jgi:ring-1,2-phenylacetyl-CoA epoxidase subunit PaaC